MSLPANLAIFFAKRIEKLIKEVASNIKIEIEWEKPQEFIKRKNRG